MIKMIKVIKVIKIIQIVESELCPNIKVTKFVSMDHQLRN
jgi:hypothetical protein